MEKNMSLHGKNWELSFFDDFDGDTLDMTRWQYCPEWPRKDVGGYWRNDQAFLDGKGHLVLQASIAPDGTPVSGAIRTLGTFRQTYGYFECRMKMHSAHGFWGAFWLMCGRVSQVTGNAVGGVEIDVVESGHILKKHLNHALHWDGYGADHKCVDFEICRPELYEGWHTYGLQWTEDAYIFYIDGEESWRTSEPGICNQPGYMKLSTEFGSWPGKIEPEKLPDCVLVDWVRAYREI